MSNLREETIALARKLAAKNPVVLRAAKHGFKRCRELTWEQSEDYLYAKLDQAQLRDPEHGREKGLKQFLDEKSIKPGLRELPPLSAEIKANSARRGATAECESAAGAAIAAALHCDSRRIGDAWVAGRECSREP